MNFQVKRSSLNTWRIDSRGFSLLRKMGKMRMGMRIVMINSLAKRHCCSGRRTRRKALLSYLKNMGETGQR